MRTLPLKTSIWNLLKDSSSNTTSACYSRKYKKKTSKNLSTSDYLAAKWTNQSAWHLWCWNTSWAQSNNDIYRKFSNGNWLSILWNSRMGWSNDRNSMGRFWYHPVVTWWCSCDKYRNSNVTWWWILFGKFIRSRCWASIIFNKTGWNSNWSDPKYNEWYESANWFWRIRNILKISPLWL